MFNEGKVFFGITPTAWTNDDMPGIGDDIPFERTLSEIALAGFQGCSVGHKYPREHDLLRRELDLRGLLISEPWVSVFFTASEMEERTIDTFREQMAFIKAMGGKHIVVAELGHAVHQQPVAVLPNKPVFDDDQWQRMVEGLDRLGRVAVENAMRLCYHHHVGTGVMTRAEVDRLMTDTNPKFVHLLLDTGHAYWAGDDPLDMARTYANRIKHVHLKDIRRNVLDRCTERRLSFLESILEGVFTVPGDGVIDFPPILQTLADADYEGWLMVEAEQDPGKANPLEYALKARAYLRDVTGL
jgi:inosose dehydratase